MVRENLRGLILTFAVLVAGGSGYALAAKDSDPNSGPKPNFLTKFLLGQFQGEAKEAALGNKDVLGSKDASRPELKAKRGLEISPKGQVETRCAQAIKSMFFNLFPQTSPHFGDLSFLRQNESNRGVYSLKTLSAQIESIGLGDNADLTRLRERGLFGGGKTYLELGAGTGRVVDFLRSEDPTSRIIALEHDPLFVDALIGRFALDKLVSIIGKSILDSNEIKEESIDVGTSMFSGLAEFSLSDQAKVFNYFAKWLKARAGVFVVDMADGSTIDPAGLPQHARLTGQRLVVDIGQDDGSVKSLTLFLSNQEQLTILGEAAGFDVLWSETYLLARGGAAAKSAPPSQRISMGFRRR